MILVVDVALKQTYPSEVLSSSHLARILFRAGLGQTDSRFKSMMMGSTHASCDPLLGLAGVMRRLLGRAAQDCRHCNIVSISQYSYY